ncbi:MAG: hypothetical protein HZB24_01460 [Desulfobacterales bacterium]|nr:hypothetical protein [Desulfobacterales bacterium]
MVELRSLKPEAIPSALEMAKRYRLLNEPDEAESICLDILAVDPGHQEALITRLLALTDKFAVGAVYPAFEQARELVARLESPYCKAYYTGLIFERRAKHHLRQGGPGAGTIAYQWLAKALEAFGTALGSCDPGKQDAVLRWNSCARILNTHPDVKPDESNQGEMLLDAYDMPH